MSIRYVILFFLLFNGIRIYSQSAEEIFEFANDQFQQEKFENAYKLYQRVLFFSEGKYNLTCYKNMAACKMAMGDPEIALNYLDIAYFSTTNDSIKNEISFQKVTALLLDQKYEQALTEVLSLDQDIPDYFNQKRFFYSGIIYFGINDFDKSEENFAHIIDNSDSSELHQLSLLFKKNDKIDRINPKTAKILSIIVPGAGQLYIGDVRNGLNSLLLNSGIAFLFFSYAQSASIINATVSIFPWYLRYYMGGYQNAEKLAIAKKQKKRVMIYEDIITLLYNYRQKQELN